MEITMQTGLPRVIGKPSELPVFAKIGADGTMQGVITFDGNPSVYPGEGPHADGSRYLPVFGREPEPPVDFHFYFFDDTFVVHGDHVIRTRTLCKR
jgi:hypothetical protein